MSQLFGADGKRIDSASDWIVRESLVQLDRHLRYFESIKRQMIQLYGPDDRPLPLTVNGATIGDTITVRMPSRYTVRTA